MLKNKLSALVMTVGLMFSGVALSQSATDNEILLDQAGDTLTLIILQQGYGNKISGDSSQGSDLDINGSTLNINLDQVGNSNKFFGAITADSSTYDWTFTGDSNVWDILIGSTGSADSGNILVDVTGDSNTFDFDLGSAASAERLDFDLTILGDSNVWDIDIEVDDSTWNFDITGDNNNFVTSQTDGTYQYMKVVHDGSGGDFDLIQSSGTCPTGTSSCYSHMDLNIDSENATVTITQKD
jgi:hypothetical protein